MILEHTIAPYHIELLPQRGVFVHELQALIVSDVHLGKGAHFRKHGVQLPDGPASADLARLTSLICRYRPTVYVVGDLVHAGHNSEWDRFAEVRATWDADVHLIAGNHDRDVKEYAEHANIRLHQSLDVHGIQLVHDPGDAQPCDVLTICGHLHPAVNIRASVHTGNRLPCFHYCLLPHGPTIILPAFGEFTGMKTIKRIRQDRVYGIVGGQVLQVP